MNLLKLIKQLGIVLGDFQPICYYDENMDELVIQLEDCSYTEHQTPSFAFLIKNHVETRIVVGVKIYNFGLLCKKYNLSLKQYNILTIALRLMLKDDTYSLMSKLKFILKCKDISLKYENLENIIKD